MKYKNLPESHLAILRKKQADMCETWAKNEQFHPTVNTYYEAFTRGAKAALSLPPMSLDVARKTINDIYELADIKEHADRAWKAFCHGDAATAAEALEATKEKPETVPADPDKDV